MAQKYELFMRFGNVEVVGRGSWQVSSIFLSLLSFIFFLLSLPFDFIPIFFYFWAFIFQRVYFASEKIQQIT